MPGAMDDAMPGNAVYFLQDSGYPSSISMLDKPAKKER